VCEEGDRDLMCSSTSILICSLFAPLCCYILMHRIYVMHICASCSLFYSYFYIWSPLIFFLITTEMQKRKLSSIASLIQIHKFFFFLLYYDRMKSLFYPHQLLWLVECLDGVVCSVKSVNKVR
jgi:hypothetical protein